MTFCLDHFAAFVLYVSPRTFLAAIQFWKANYVSFREALCLPGQVGESQHIRNLIPRSEERE
jgi:hypothetical protein